MRDSMTFFLRSLRGNNLLIFTLLVALPALLIYSGCRNNMKKNQARTAVKVDKVNKKSSKIVYLAGTSEHQDIFVMNEDGSGKKQLTKTGFSVEWPTWSPDGRSIMFITYEAKHRGLYLVESSGENLRKINIDTDIPDTPCWSGNGKQIAFTYSTKTGRGIMVVDADGKNPKLLTGKDVDGAYQAWSPTAPLIFFESGRDGNPEIYCINPETGKDLRRLTENKKLDEWPGCSRDGSLIVWAQGVEGDKDLWVMSSDGTSKRQVTRNIAIGDSFPSFSPVGDRIVFTSSREGKPPAVYTVKLDGSGLRKIAEGSSPNWSPYLFK